MSIRFLYFEMKIAFPFQFNGGHSKCAKTFMQHLFCPLLSSYMFTTYVQFSKDCGHVLSILLISACIRLERKVCIAAAALFKLTTREKSKQFWLYLSICLNQVNTIKLKIYNGGLG